MHSCSSGLFIWAHYLDYRAYSYKYDTVKPIGADPPDTCTSFVFRANIL